VPPRTTCRLSRVQLDAYSLTKGGNDIDQCIKRKIPDPAAQQITHPRLRDPAAGGDRFAFVWFSDLKGHEDTVPEVLDAVARKIDRREDLFAYLAEVATEAEERSSPSAWPGLRNMSI